MLEEITISNLGVIKQATLPFTPGLTVLSGETGAGKTMVLSALHLLMGRRSDAAIVRHGAASASAEGCWTLAPGPLLEAAEATGAEVEDGQLFINRTVRSDGKSRAVLGGKTTPTKVLAGVTANLVSIHGQADQMRLKNPDAQRVALDKYGHAKIASALSTYSKTYKRWRVLTKQLATVKDTADVRRFEYEALKAFMEDFEQVSPEDGEVESLQTEVDRLSHLDAIRDGVHEALAMLVPEDYDAVPAEAQLRQVHSLLHKLSAHDSNLDPVIAAVQEALSALDDAASTLETYSASLDEDGLERLHAAQERLREVKAFAKKYKRTVPELIERAASAEQRLEELDPEKHSVEALEEAVAESHGTLVRQAEKLTKLRTVAATALAEEVNEELAGLAMGGTTLVLTVEPALLSSTGADDVQFQLVTPGSPLPRPISKAASGGELSRIMLALEVVLTSPEDTPTFVFDEVDSGVGGATAIEIGRRLAKLAEEAQVIVVTHLPQVACFAQNHLRVLKTSHKSTTETSVKQLAEAERVEEITRMLSGLSESESGRAHAEELLKLAADAKAAFALTRKS